MGRGRLLALLLVAVPAAIAAAVLLPHSPAGVRELLLSVGPFAPLITLAAWVVLTPFLFPGTVLAAAGGLTFGSLTGSALAFGGAVAGGVAAFLLARTGARETVTRFVARSPRLGRVHALVERRGFTAILAARLTPGVPVTGLHYAAGVAPVGLHAFTAAMAIGALLRTVPYALLGQGLASGSLAGIGMAVASIVAGGVVAGLLFRQVRRPVAVAAA